MGEHRWIHRPPRQSTQHHEQRGAKSPRLSTRALALISLTMSYFHTGTRTIIGAESFHCPVRDGKEWDQLAMVIRLNRWLGCTQGNQAMLGSAVARDLSRAGGTNEFVESPDRAAFGLARLGSQSADDCINAFSMKAWTRRLTL